MSEGNVCIDGQVRISFSPGKMHAFLEVTAPVGSGHPCQRDDVWQALREHEVRFGMKEEVIELALQQENWNHRLLVAEGREAENGADGKIIYKFPLPYERVGPKEDDKGNVDYHDLGLIYNVKMGQMLVERVPPTDGTPGRDVSEGEVPPKRGKDLRLPRGKNTVSDQDERYLYAAVDGHVAIIDGKVAVDPVLVIPQDIDYSTGDINFVGNVVINGNVAAGFKVKADGDIEIKGFIEGAEVVAGGSVQVKGGITTGAKGYVKAAQSLYARFIENSRVEAGLDVMVREGIMQSSVKAGGSIKVSDRKAIIVGGTIQASQLVESKVLGSQLATQTNVEVGINPHLREEYQQLFKLRSEKKKIYENLSQNLAAFQRSGVSPDHLSDKKRLTLIKMLDEFKTLRQELNNLEERINFLETEFEKTQLAKVRVLEIVYPGVRISIGRSIYIVNDPIKYSEFVLQDGEVRLSSLR